MRASVDQRLMRAARSAFPGLTLIDAGVEPTRDPRFGDLASALPLGLARSAGLPPMAIASAIAAAFAPDSAITAVEPAAPGYLNVRWRDDWLAERLCALARGEAPPATPSPDTPLRLALATGGLEDAEGPETLDHPAYLVRYTHAWLTSLLQLAEREGIGAWDGRSGLDLGEPATRELVLAVLAGPDEVALSAARRSPERLFRHAVALCHSFRRFYARHRLFGESAETARSRRAVAQATLRSLDHLVVDVLGLARPGPLT